MLNPKFSYDNQELSYKLEEIERIEFRVQRMLLMPKHEDWLRREAFIRTAYSSTMIENATITEQELERAAQVSPTAEIPKNRPDVVNYGNVLNFIDFISELEDYNITYEAIIRQIHWILMKDIHDTHIHPGNYRTVPNWIEDQGVKVYESPYHVDVPILMREFSLWLEKGEKIHPVLMAGIAHAHLIAIHPFVDGNGRTARLLATLLLQKNGYGFKKLLSLDSYYQRNRDEYLMMLQESIGKQFTPDYDLTSWLDFFAKSMIRQGQLLEQKLTDWRMKVDKIHSEWAGTGYSDRQIDGIIYAATFDHITRKDYIEIADVSPLTATRDLQRLVEGQLLKPEGKGRNRIYKYIGEIGETDERKESPERLL